MLPLAHDAPAGITAKPAANDRGGRILVIEDNADLLLIYEMMLENWGYQGALRHEW